MSKRSEIKEMLENGETIEDIKAELNCSTSYIHRTKKSMDKPESITEPETKEPTETTETTESESLTFDGSGVERFQVPLLHK